MLKPGCMNQLRWERNTSVGEGGSREQTANLGGGGMSRGRCEERGRVRCEHTGSSTWERSSGLMKWWVVQSIPVPWCLVLLMLKRTGPGTAEAVTAAPEHWAGTKEPTWCFNAAVDLKSRSGVCREESVLWDLLLFQPNDGNTELARFLFHSSLILTVLPNKPVKLRFVWLFWASPLLGNGKITPNRNDIW